MKVVFPFVVLSSTVKIVGKITRYCYGEHQCSTDPERTCSHNAEYKQSILMDNLRIHWVSP